MALFDNASVVEDTVWQMRLADYPRSVNRSQINSLFNGQPPFDEEVASANNININVNFLEATKLAHDARRQFANMFTKPGKFFTVKVDRGPKHKRREISNIISNAINKPLKRSLPYFECFRSQFANVVLHGIGPVSWDDRESWCPDPLGIEDVMMPGNTRLTMKNVPFFAIFRPYTAHQLRKMTSGPKVDPAWNIPLVNKLIKNAEEQVLDFGIPQSEIYSPEKMSERVKQDGGFVAGDSVPTIDAWDFFFWNDEGKVSGWNRRIILDANWQGGVSGHYASKTKLSDTKTKLGTRGQFLYNPQKRKYATKMNQLIHFEFGDLSAVAPFRYHSVRSLGFVVFGACHVLTRLQCSFIESLFEHLCQYFRVSSMEEAEHVLKINLFNRAFVDKSVEFIPRNERWQIDPNLAQMGLAHIQQIIARNSSSYIQDFAKTTDETQKTATQVMAEVQSTTALVSSAIQQAYEYQKHQYYEIGSRFSRKNSRDADVRAFRAEVLRAGVPEECLESECWEIEPERVMGAGNKLMETAIAERLMSIRPQLDPEPQRDVTRDFVLAITDDSDRANRLVPVEPVKITDSVHDAQLAAGTLFQGLRLDVKTGINHIEYVETLLAEMASKIQQIEGRGSMATIEEIAGLANMANHIGQHVAVIAQNPEEKQRVRQYGDDIGEMMNIVKAYEERLMEQRQKAAQDGGGNGGMDPKDMAKVQGMMIMANTKAENARESHAQRTAQRQTQFELELARDSQRHRLEMEKKMAELDANLTGTEMTTASSIRKNRLKSLGDEE